MIQLAYGRTQIELDVPGDQLLGVYGLGDKGNIPDESTLLSDAMANPIGTTRLRELAKPGEKIAIITSDISRPCPSERMLPFILSELNLAGVPDGDVTIVIALGMHRAMTEKEIVQIVSRGVAERYRVLNHDPRNVLRIGITEAGTPVEIFRPVVEADRRICLGNLEFHYYAGYSGGAKAIVPGVASRATVLANHALMTRPGAETGQIDGNPVRMDFEEAVAMIGVDFMLNVVLDGQKRIVSAVAGDSILAHRAGCEVVRKRGTVNIPQRADIVIAGAGGYPKDINLYQAHKALRTAKYFVRVGGIIILVAECIEGIGNRVLSEWLLDAGSPDAIIDRLQNEFVFGGHIAASIAAIRKRAQIFLVSHLPAEIARRGMMEPFEMLQSAFDAAVSQLGTGSRVIVLPQAGSMLPIVGGD